MNRMWIYVFFHVMLVSLRSHHRVMFVPEHHDFTSPHGGNNKAPFSRPKRISTSHINHGACTLSSQRIVVLIPAIMVLMWSSAFALVFAGLVSAAALKRQSITPLSSTQIASYDPFTHFASTAYCDPSTTINWTCGGASRRPSNAVQSRRADPTSSASQLRGQSRLCARGIRRRW